MVSDFKVSVVIPVYKAEAFIRRAIDSVLMQPEVAELILVIDGNYDSSMRICMDEQKLDQRIVILHHKGYRNKGVSASRNLGIRKANSPFIAFLDADDYYLANRFKQTRKCFEEDQSVEGVYEAVGVHHNPLDIRTFSLLKSVSYDILFESLSPIGFDGWFHCNGVTTKKICLQKCGLFDEDLKTSEDTLLWLKMAARCKLVSGNIHEAVAIAERTAGSLSSNRIQVNKDQITMLYKLFLWLNTSEIINEEEKKELTLKTIINLQFNNNMHFLHRIINAINVIAIIGRTDFKFLYQSSAIRRMLGSLIGYNRLLGILK
jgi:glycosyltransferase involved in cell wall biosynthesis